MTWSILTQSGFVSCILSLPRWQITPLKHVTKVSLIFRLIEISWILACCNISLHLANNDSDYERVTAGSNWLIQARERPSKESTTEILNTDWGNSMWKSWKTQYVWKCVQTSWHGLEGQFTTYQGSGYMEENLIMLVFTMSKIFRIGQFIKEISQAWKY